MKIGFLSVLFGVAVSSEIYVVDFDSIHWAMADQTIIPPKSLSEHTIEKRDAYIRDNGIPRPLVYALDKLKSRNSAAFFVFVWSHQNARAIMEKYFVHNIAMNRREILTPSIGGLKEAWKTFKQGDFISFKKRPRDPIPAFYDDTIEQPCKSYIISADDPPLQLFNRSGIPNQKMIVDYKRRYCASVLSCDILYRKKRITKQLRLCRNPRLDHLIDNLGTKYPQDQSRQISILSYNILLKGLDVKGHEWDMRKGAIIQHIQKHDLIGLQEVTGQQYIDLKAALLGYKFIAINAVTGRKIKRSDNLYDEGMVVMYRREMFDVSSESHWWISSTPSIPSKDVGSDTGAYCKVTQRIEFVRKKDGLPFVFYNNHFPHGSMTEKWHNSRDLAAKMELDYIYQDLRSGKWFVSVGDRNFRDTRDHETYMRYLDKVGVGDASQSGNRGHKTTILGYGADAVAIDRQGKFSSSSMLDVIFYGTERASVLDCLINPVEYDEEGKLLPLGAIKDPEARRFGSDHAAVSARFKLYQ